jgi:hypothetical protein
MQQHTHASFMECVGLSEQQPLDGGLAETPQRCVTLSPARTSTSKAREISLLEIAFRVVNKVFVFSVLRLLTTDRCVSNCLFGSFSRYKDKESS